MTIRLCQITILTALLGLAGCGCNPDRVEHEKIPGVDTDTNRTYDPNRKSSFYLRSNSSADADFLRQLATDLVAVHRETSGVFAILPALTRTSDRTENHTTPPYKKC